MALTWEDINFKNKTISIDKTVTIGLNSKRLYNLLKLIHL